MEDLTFIKYTPSLGVNPCRMVAKTITNVYKPVFRFGKEEGCLPPMAIPRTTQRSAECPAETRMLNGLSDFFHL